MSRRYNYSRKGESRRIKVTESELAQAIENELVIYSNNVILGTKEEAKRHMDLLVATTKATAPVGNHNRRHYKNMIDSRILGSTPRAVAYLWYVKDPDYRLSHLLERGHAKRNGGRTKAFHFIENATTPILLSYQKAIEEVIRNG